MNKETIHPMESKFNTSHEIGPSVHVGSQTMEFFEGDPKEQSYEARHLAAGKAGDIVVVRNIDSDYLSYWKSLTDSAKVLDLGNIQPGLPLTKVLLSDQPSLEWIQAHMSGKATLQVFLPTRLEEQLAKALSIPLHGSAEIADLYGTKSGIRLLADEFGITMSPGFICTSTEQVKQAATYLLQEGGCSALAVKHDLSTGGGWSAKVTTIDLPDIAAILTEKVGNGNFTDGKDVVVVEGWIDNAKASVCAHIEIPSEGDPVICAGWQQVIDTDGITYLGAGPLVMNQKAMDSFYEQASKLAYALKAKGAVGSFGPDFLITEDDKAVMLELNARTPATRFPLAIVKALKPEIGSGFMAKHVKIPGKKPVRFADIQDALGPLLITKSQGDETRGVVPFNVGLLPYGMFDLVAIAPSWEEAQEIMNKAQALFH